MKFHFIYSLLIQLNLPILSYLRIIPPYFEDIILSFNLSNVSHTILNADKPRNTLWPFSLEKQGTKSRVRRIRNGSALIEPPPRSAEGFRKREMGPDRRDKYGN